MSSAIGNVFKSFWHSMTSNDRHSEFDSPYRTGRHVPLGQGGRMGGLTSVATASESRTDVTSPYTDSTARFSRNTTAYEPSAPSPSMASPSLVRPYSPGLRGESAKRTNEDGFETQSPSGEIPMQAFQDGLPPPPPVSHSWTRIDRWTEENYPELFDQLCEGCTNNDLNELEHQLDCSLPLDVRESLQIHDGQERPGLPTGIIFSAMLLDCEEIVQEWENWRKVNHEFLLDDTTMIRPAVPSKALGGSSSSQASSSRAAASASPNKGNWRQELLSRQDCVPANAIQKAYAHPAWIPLVRDWGGNNLAVDLAPGPAGHWGQVILFGRDYDTKYVVARSWSSFMALVADDLNSGKWWIDEDSKELKLREFKTSRVEPSYFDILRWRTDQKYGRRGPKRKSVVPPGAVSPTSAGSPYMSPTEPPNGEPRGRQLQRLGVSSPLASPNRPGYGKSSPLARVTEETSLPDSELGIIIPNDNIASQARAAKEKLVELDTPRLSVSTDEGSSSLGANGVGKTPRLAALVNGTAHSPPSGATAADEHTAVTAPTTAPTTTSTPAAAVELNARSLTSNSKQSTVIEESAMKTIDI